MCASPFCCLPYQAGHDVEVRDQAGHDREMPDRVGHDVGCGGAERRIKFCHETQLLADFCVSWQENGEIVGISATRRNFWATFAFRGRGPGGELGRSGGVAVIEVACPPPDTGRGRGPT